MCLQNVLEDNNKSLQPDCFKMLTKRIEMFRNAAKVINSIFFNIPIYCILITYLFIYFQLIAPNSIQELYSTVNQSPARRYFMIVALTMIGLIFITGLFCGRVTRRTMIMKNK